MVIRLVKISHQSFLLPVISVQLQLPHVIDTADYYVIANKFLVFDGNSASILLGVSWDTFKFL